MSKADPAASISPQVLDGLIKCAKQGDPHFGRLVLTVFVAKVKAGEVVPDALLNYIAERLGDALRGDTKKVPHALNLISRKRGPNAGKRFKPFRDDYVIAQAVKTLTVRMPHYEAVLETADIACCSKSKVERAWSRFKAFPIDILSKDGILPNDFKGMLSKLRRGRHPRL